MRAAGYTLHVIADTRDHFADFRPYVAAINDDGVVAFQAALARGGTGVFASRGDRIVTIADTAPGSRAACCSHPDIDRSGAAVFHATLGSGDQAVLRCLDDDIVTVASTPGGLARIGPLGPTCNEDGAVAFRADLAGGESAILSACQGKTTIIARTGEDFAAFEGLPVITPGGAVVFRAALPGGGQGIYCHDERHADRNDERHDARQRGGAIVTLVETGSVFRDLGRFPAAGGDDAVVFAATLVSGRPGIFTVTDGVLATIVTGDAAFESVRGALIDSRGTVVFYATPPGGALGIYAGSDPASDGILATGDALLGSAVASFALNPVSMNVRGQLAIRVELESGLQAIIRADPP